MSGFRASDAKRGNSSDQVSILHSCSDFFSVTTVKNKNWYYCSATTSEQEQNQQTHSMTAAHAAEQKQDKDAKRTFNRIARQTGERRERKSRIPMFVCFGLPASLGWGRSAEEENSPVWWEEGADPLSHAFQGWGKRRRKRGRRGYFLSDWKQNSVPTGLGGGGKSEKKHLQSPWKEELPDAPRRNSSFGGE